MATERPVVQDLGVLDGPVLLFGGPCSNLQATRAVLAEGVARGIPARASVCTGDVVAYCGSPRETVREIRRSGVHVVAGNCEKKLAARAAGCGCGFEEGSVCDRLSASWYEFADARLGSDDRHWMADLPDTITFSHQGERYGVIHGGITDVAKFIWPVSDISVFSRERAALEALTGPLDHIIAGHCGVPFIQDAGPGSWINAGIIGIPPHDGRQMTRFAVLDGGEVLIHLLKYDVSGAWEAMNSAGLRQGYHTALRTGYWPSDDVLPDALRVPSLASG